MARRKIARSSSPSTTTGTGVESPIVFESETSSKSTPGTTPGPFEDVPKASSKRGKPNRPSKTLGKRRAPPSDGEEQLSEVEDPAPAATRGGKRRTLRSQVYVEIPPRAVAARRTKALPEPSPAKRRRRSTVVAKSVPSSDAEDDELLDGDSDLEYNESEDSGSEFQDSDASESDEAEISLHDARGNRIRAVDDYESVSGLEEDDGLITGAAENDEEEQADMEAAIMASIAEATELQSARSRGSSSRGAASVGQSARETAAALRARAAEKRQRRAQTVDDTAAFAEEGESSELSELSEEEDDFASPKAMKGKKAGKRKGKEAVKVASTSKAKKMTLAEMRRQRREAKAALRIQNNPVKHEERLLRQKLGRKLTHAERSTIALYLYHPELKNTWGDLEAAIPIIKPERAEQPKRLKAALLPFQQESLFWMRKQELGVWAGGMLADEMGMGKTIQMLALLCSDVHKPNLIVAPTVAVMQWRNEIEAHTTGFKVAVWHGNAREKNASDLAKFDIVLTTYAILESAFRKQEKGFVRKGQVMKEKSALHSIEWTRIILDEAHNIKERSTNTAKGAFELTGKYKWCLSGTPLQNRVGELYSLIRFLGGDPFSYYFCKRCDCKSLHWKFSNKKTCDDCGHSPMMHTCFWNNEILTPIQKNAMAGPGKIAFKKLKILLDRMMLRRTKLERADDLGLPPRTVIVRRDYFSDEEKELYLSLFSDAKRQFSTYVDSGTVLNNYSNIFSLLTRMRQMACHPDLVLKSRRNVELSGDIVEATICRICHDVAEDAIKSKCHHIFDRQCIQQYIDASGQDTPACPVCHLALTIDLEAPALEQDNEEATTKARQGILGRLDHGDWRSSSKIEALVEELERLRRKDATTKSLVFSQFVNFLDLIAWRLQRAGFVICRLEGTMSPQARDATIKHFMNNVEVTVFLVSLKAGGVALNLTEASRVYLMDSWWNPSVEYQAMDRIHRLGQHRPVHAIKLVIEDSIESRIVQLQEKKLAMVTATLSSDDSAMGRLTEEDLGFLFRL